jgi:autotransporter-associated beta strand protein
MRPKGCGVLMLAALSALIGLLAPSAAAASTYRWQVDANGDWHNPANWAVVEGPAGAGYPNLAGDVAVFDIAPSALRFITIPDAVTITVGRIAFDYTSTADLVINRTGSGALVFDNLGEDAVIDSAGVGTRNIFVPVQLTADLVVNGSNGNGVLMDGISESGGARNVTLTGGALVYGANANTYSGTTTITSGGLSATDGVAIRIPGVLIVGDGTGSVSSATFSSGGNSVNPVASVTVLEDGVAAFQRAFGQGTGLQVGDVTIHGGAVNVAGTGTRLSMASLTMEGGSVETLSSTAIVNVTGSVTATSTAAEYALIRSFANLPQMLQLSSPTTDFTVADGPQSVDLWINGAITGVNGGEALRKLGPGVARFSNGTNTYTGATTVVGGTLLVDSTQASSAVSVGATAALGGSGTVGSITTASGSALLVGGTELVPVVGGLHGILRSNSVVLASDTTVRVDIAGGTAGAEYDQLRVTGTVSLGNAALVPSAALVLPAFGTFTIIDNDGVDPVIGIFNNLPEGTLFGPSNTVFRISYQGGDGNDVVLTNMTDVKYYLSEGATGTFFDEDVLIANPNSVAAPITMTFFLPGGSTIVQQRTVPAQARITVHVDEIPGLEATSPSLEVKSDNRLPLGVDRTMFWDHTHYGGHTANAVPEPRRQWLFAEGAQNDFFQTYLLLGNPNLIVVNVIVTFLREGEPSVMKFIEVPAQSRLTVYAGDYPELVGRSFGMIVNNQLPIAAERAMYFASTPTRLWTGGHANVGSPDPSTSWFHPEGASGTFFSTFILVSNPQDTAAEVTYKFLLPTGETVETTRTIPAKQRVTVNPVDTGDLRLANAAFSTVVTSNVPVVSERAMYWPGDGVTFGEGHSSSGLTSTALDWVLGEGRTGGPSAYSTYILLANPQSQAANVTVTFFRESGAPVVKTVTVDATSRFNIDINSMVPELQNESFGARVEVTNNVPIAVERSMYWNADGRFWAGGSNALGSVIPR